jgi:peptide/nickel transport system permease protein
VNAAVEPVGVPGSPALAGTGLPPSTPWQLFWRRFRSDRLAMASLGFLALLCLVAIFAPLVVDLIGLPGPNERDPSARDVFGTATGPSVDHPLGVDDAGRDVASRTIYGARISLIVAFLATGLATILGVASGVLAGYKGGWVDTVVSRSVDVLLAIPYLLLATGFAASCSLGDGCFGGALKPGLGVVIFVIAFTSWTYIARIVRGETLSLREREFVEAARATGAPDRVIVFREVLPNLVTPIIVYASVLIPQVILYEAALSFLGVGVAAPTASWGQMISDATGIFADAWWYMLFPGLALLFTVIAFNVVGDALQDALNPKATRSS